MKKISFAQANYILRRKEKHSFERLFCDWKINVTSPNTGYITCTIKWWVYALLFLPVHLVTFIYCLWDGGIKEFRVQSREVHHYNSCGLTSDSAETQFGRLKEVWGEEE